MEFPYYSMRQLLLRILCIILVFLPMVLNVKPVHAVSFHQGNDPVDQCKKRVENFNNGNYSIALAFFGAGFNSRENGEFSNPGDLGYCAFTLGIVYFNLGRMNQSLEAYQVALKVFRDINSREFEGYRLNNMASVYYAQGQYAKTLEYTQQALVVIRKLPISLIMKVKCKQY